MSVHIEILQGDITRMDVDAIVNAANNQLILGAGVAGAIRRAGGPAIQEECDSIGPIPLGESAITGGGNLKARYVVHAASMGAGSTTTKQTLVQSTRNSLLRAEEKGLSSIAFPAIGTGVAGFPMAECARLMMHTVTDYFASLEADSKQSSIERVLFVLFDEAGLKTFQSALNDINA